MPLLTSSTSALQRVNALARASTVSPGTIPTTQAAGLMGGARDHLLHYFGDCGKIRDDIRDHENLRDGDCSDPIKLSDPTTASLCMQNQAALMAAKLAYRMAGCGPFERMDR